MVLPAHIAFESPDQPEVHGLIRELDAYLYALFPPECVYAMDIASLLQPAVHFAVIRDAGGTALGCGAVVIKPDYAEIKRVYVAPSMRGHGLARALVAALEAKAVAQGRRDIMLETGPTQVEACILYERLGYQVRGPFGDYPPDPHSLFMHKRAAVACV